MIRCVNIDWLECYCLEPAERRQDAEYFRELGFEVVERDYGTRVYAEMFTLLDVKTNLPFLEIRRCPKGNKTQTGIYVIDPQSCHLRLVNRYCYNDNAAEIMNEFIRRYRYTFMRISRIDICLDFERFDSGDDPKKFLRRYIQGKYSKINQSNISVRGKDWWDGRDWNSVSWGSPQSQIGTKMYNKTLELREVKDKPYIRQAWAVCGLVDDFIELSKGTGENKYYPQIWRLEFSIRSSVKRWFVIEDFSAGKKQLRSIRNELDRYFTRADLLNVFASLCSHYFHFKKFKPDLRKDRCEDKVLWKFDKEMTQFYTVEHVASQVPAVKFFESLRKKLEEYLCICYDDTVKEACRTIIQDLIRVHVRNAAENPYSESEVALLRHLISMRIYQSEKEPLSDSVEKIKSLMTLEGEIFQ